MSRLDKLLAKPKELEINGERFNIYPLTVMHLDLINKMEKEETRTEAMRQIVKITLKKAVPDATEDDLNNISLEFLEPIINAIVEVNGLADDKTTAIKEKLAQQRALQGKDISN